MELRLRKDEGPRLELLRRVPILHGIEARSLRSLLDDAGEETFPAGHAIVKDGSLLANLYIILEGEVEVRKKKTVIAKLGKGQFFGEMAFLNDQPTGRSADIVATEETRCLSIEGPAWYGFLRKNPDVAIEVIGALARRLRQSGSALSELQNLPASPP
ncbi:MAG: cyclic nucleotide-binding domain-containing protein [Nitrososphaerales archaeon]